jgi:hypothetical protein
MIPPQLALNYFSLCSDNDVDGIRHVDRWYVISLTAHLAAANRAADGCNHVGTRATMTIEVLTDQYVYTDDDLTRSQRHLTQTQEHDKPSPGQAHKCGDKTNRTTRVGNHMDDKQGDLSALNNILLASKWPIIACS